MKKAIMMILFVSTTLFAVAQDSKTTVVEDKKTVKKTSSVPQKVHNTFSKHKHYNGKKTTHVKKVEKTNN